jgi:hypothetical protein
MGMTCVCGGIWLSYHGKETAGLGIATVSVVGLVTAFLRGVAAKREERVEKAKVMTGRK